MFCSSSFSITTFTIRRPVFAGCHEINDIQSPFPHVTKGHVSHGQSCNAACKECGTCPFCLILVFALCLSAGASTQAPSFFVSISMKCCSTPNANRTHSNNPTVQLLSDQTRERLASRCLFDTFHAHHFESLPPPSLAVLPNSTPLVCRVSPASRNRWRWLLRPAGWWRWRLLAQHAR